MKDANCIAKIPYNNYTYICNNNVDDEKWFNVSSFQYLTLKMFNLYT